jgi:hypothetical protein
MFYALKLLKWVELFLPDLLSEGLPDQITSYRMSDTSSRFSWMCAGGKFSVQDHFSVL